MDISVVIAVLNGASILPRQLEALQGQTFAGTWELLICDNGSKDDLAGLVAQWNGLIPMIRLIDASQTLGDGHAKQTGIQLARAERVAICDADDVVGEHWLQAIFDALDTADVVTGPLGPVSFHAVEERGPSACFAEVQFTTGPKERHSVPYASGCNMGLRRDAVPRGYARDYLMGSDGATSWRAIQDGASFGWSGSACILYRQRPQGRKSFGRYILAGVAGRRQDREFADLFGIDNPPSVLRGMAWLLLHVHLLASATGRERWRIRLATTLGALMEAVRPGWWFSLQERRRGRMVAASVARTR